jgi:putative oxidoreductase
METILKLNRWANAHANYGIDVLRILLGAFLFYKGLFLFSTSSYEADKILESMPGLGGNLILIHYIAMVEICGGIFIALGLLTRVSALLQIPVLLAAVIINSMQMTNPTALIESAACLLLSVFFVIYGSGKHSIDHGLRLHV